MYFHYIKNFDNKKMTLGTNWETGITGSLVRWVECLLMGRETFVQSPGLVIPKTLKILLDTSLLNTQQYKVHIKGKVEQSRERSSALSYTSV